MSTIHNEAHLEDIAKTVIMPGDPLRAKYIAESFLTDAKLVNSVRGIYAFTGLYQNKKITVMASGMGMPSMGIYSYELFKYYNVENIIRIGSCGGYDPNLKLFDIILAQDVYTEGNYALTFNNQNCHIISSDRTLNEIISQTAKTSNINLVTANTICTDAFDLYMSDQNEFFSRLPDGFNPAASEMEAFALFYNARFFNKRASCLMSVVDSKFIKNVATTEERQTGLNTMIKLALDSTLKLD